MSVQGLLLQLGSFLKSRDVHKRFPWALMENQFLKLFFVVDLNLAEVGPLPGLVSSVGNLHLSSRMSSLD